MRKVLELAGHATAQAGSNDWWWQERLGKAYYQLGLLRDADKHFAAAAELQVCRILEAVPPCAVQLIAVPGPGLGPTQQ